MNRVLKWLAMIVFLAACILIGLYRYWVFVPEVGKPLLAGEYSRHTLIFGDLERRYSVYRPPALREGAPAIFVLHGSTRTGDIVRSQSAYEFDRLADQLGFIVVYPDGFENHWNDCRASAQYSANTLKIDDPAFLSDVVLALEDDLGIDPNRVFMAGFSNGGQMVMRLALEQPSLARAYGVIGANLPALDNLDCEPSDQAVSIAYFTGTLDPVNPYQGGVVNVGGETSRGLVLSAQETLGYWLELAGIEESAELITHGDKDGNLETSVEQRRWSGASREIRQYVLHGSGHVIPSFERRFPRLSGPPAADISAAAELGEYFLNIPDE